MLSVSEVLCLLLANVLAVNLAFFGLSKMTYSD